MNAKLRDRVAIVTGASGSIGSETVRAFAAAGVHVVLAAPESESPALERLAAEAREYGVRALAVPTDLTRRADIDRLIAATIDAFDAIDILANVAGTSSAPSLADDSDADLERVIAVNLLGCARTIHAVLPVMKRQRRGAIINIGSVAGEAGIMGIYSASKFGLRGLTDTVRREAASYNLSVTLVEPGFIRSELNHALGERLPGPDVVARVILRAAVRARRRVIVPWYYALAVGFAQAFPGFIDLVFGNPRIQRRLNRDARADREAERQAT
ncbi:MAG: SDR family oxidoreductase [Candidatus Eremiobacteraeota bacterium]|nr:SDR family oxidoreductase [Candidatus Eremiobacteraeota bacterium]